MATLSLTRARDMCPHSSFPPVDPARGSHQSARDDPSPPAGSTAGGAAHAFDSEAALAAAHRRLDAALLAGEVGTFEWDICRQRVSGDANFARMFGIPLDTHGPDAGTAPLERYIDVIHPDDRAHMRAAVARTVERGDDYRVEYRVMTAEGIRGLLVRAKPERDASGRVVRAAGVCLDVTERMRAEAALQRSEARWNAAIEHFDEGAIIATAGEQVIYWNPAARRLHGFRSDTEGIGPLADTPATFELWTPDGARQLSFDEWPMRRLQRGEPVRNMELRLRRPDQRWEKYVAYSGAIVETAAGERLIFLSVHDLTDRVRAEAARRLAEALYRDVFDNIDLAFHRCEIVTDEQGRPVDYILLDVNPAWARTTGFDAATAIGRRGSDLVPLDAKWIAACGRAAIQREQIRIEQHFPSLGKWYDVHLVPFGPSESRQFLSTAADITARKAAEAERETVRRAAEEANRSKSEFLANMSHELRTPLNAIAGHVQLVELGLHGPVTSAHLDALGRVQQAQRHLLRLINDVLNFAKLEAGRIEFDVRPTAPAPLLREVGALIEAQVLAKGLALEIRVPPDAEVTETTAVRWEIWADRDKLAQVLLNLLSNAIKFTPPRQASGVPGLIALSLTMPSGAESEDVEVHVIDTGIGIPGDRLEVVFDPFVQVSAGLTRQFEGTGLGLAISRDLTRAMGADLRVESTPGVGSTFTISLRRARENHGLPTDRRARRERREGMDRRAEERRRGNHSFTRE